MLDSPELSNLFITRLPLRFGNNTPLNELITTRKEAMSGHRDSPTANLREYAKE